MHAKCPSDSTTSSRIITEAIGGMLNEVGIRAKLHTQDQDSSFAAGLALEFKGVSLMSSGCKNPPFTLIIRLTANHPCSIIFRHINDAATR